MTVLGYYATDNANGPTRQPARQDALFDNGELDCTSNICESSWHVDLLIFLTPFILGLFIANEWL